MLRLSDDWWDKVGQPALVIYLSCPRDEAKRRYLSRKIPGRVEDTDEMFEKRYSDYQVKIVQIGGRYREANILEEVRSTMRLGDKFLNSNSRARILTEFLRSIRARKPKNRIAS